MIGFIVADYSINESVLWCLIGGFVGMWVLIKRLDILRGDITTKMSDAFPVLLGTLVWLTSAYTFYDTGFNSPIDTQRVLMIISWGMLAGRLNVNDLTNGSIFKR